MVNVFFQGVGPACGVPLGRGISMADKSVILDLHNQLRARVANGVEVRGLPGPQPPASDMLELVWDDEVRVTPTRIKISLTTKSMIVK